MLKNMFGNRKKYAQYFLPSCITLIIYCIILAVKGIYPFGSNTIDYYDMAQQIAAFYYHVYDMLHGTKAFFYDWYSALGTNMAMSTSGCSNLSPFNLFFLFINRSSLLKSLSVFNGIKLMCMSFTMYFYLNKTHEKSPFFFKLAASVGYSFCGFVLVLYITNQWVDIAALFPLIMYFYDRLIETGRMKGYVITLAITLIASYYLGFMILIFIFLYTGLRLAEALICGSKDRMVDITPENGSPADDVKADMHLTQLGIGTFLALALSSFILIPQLAQMFNSARFKNGNESEASGLIGRYIEIISHVRGDYTTRWWSLLGISFAAAVILTGIIRFRKERRTIVITASMILLMVLELFFESINLIWHFGSYVQYPIRNGFIINFVFAYLSCYFAGRLYGSGKVPGSETGDGTARENAAGKADDEGHGDRAYISFAVTVVGFLVFIGFYRNHTGLPLRRVFHMTSAMMAVSFLFYMVILNIEEIKQLLRRFKAGKEEKAEKGYTGKNTVTYRWAAGVLVLEILCYGFLLFGKPDFITGYSEEPEQNGQYIYLCEQLREKLDLGNDFIYRIKNPDESLNANYGFVLMQPALSNWTHMIAPGEQEGAASWGYSIQFTRVLDSGGTVFSDALIGIRKVISTIPMDPRLYTEINRAEIYVNPGTQETVTYYLYEPLYTLPFGVVLNNAKGTEESREDGTEVTDRADGTGDDTVDHDIVKLHNSIYHSIIDSDDSDIASWFVKDNKAAEGAAEADVSISASDKTVTSVIRVKDETALYVLGSGGDMEYANCTIEVGKDGDMRTVTVPTIGDPGNIYYPAHFNNNAVYLGCYKDETVDVRVNMDGDKGEYFDVDIIGVSLEAMKSLCSTYTGTDDNGIKAYGNGLTLNAAAGAEDTDLLLPVTFDKGFGITVNGKRVKGASYAGLFTIIPLEEGENTVNMRFIPPGMVAGVLITLITAALLIAYTVIMRINKESLEAVLQKPESLAEPVLVRLYAAVFAAAILFIYIIPVFYGIYVLVAGK